MQVFYNIKSSFKKIVYILGFACVTLASSCKEKEKPTVDNRDSPLKGTIKISVDESFKPVIEQELEMYHVTYPNSNIIAEYKSEADCLKDLAGDSTRIIVIGRGLDTSEIRYYKEQLDYVPKYQVEAFDALTLITNVQSHDSAFTFAQLKSLLEDKKPSNNMVVVDGENATSTVTYLMDSILHGKEFGINVKGAGNSPAVLDIVATNPNAIGFVGSSWIGNFKDPKQEAYLKKIRPAMIECKICGKGVFAKPAQASISSMQYPLFRPVYAIVKENYLGLGSGFYNFLSSERGQLIFSRALLVPAQMAFNIQKVNLK
ncbi:PstS family phosphate ABC transporter substrate-binding protein [Rhizosphaericola mali]|uniref:Phosphate ABC transporter substrate-binding protein, PhoT family n=1 Tax=Rhizosphaericola mali TaxID=2545455 RepID=A0A5P2G7G2_9BACT|nr:substrate-binding domain-containing protein [Rhizosphaericola mali]QES90638.1 phosphate ABC transporter substrate-binding protein, PhoT family [Rhizosphaericola mali]